MDLSAFTNATVKVVLSNKESEDPCCRREFIFALMCYMSCYALTLIYKAVITLCIKTTLYLYNATMLFRLWAISNCAYITVIQF